MANAEPFDVAQLTPRSTLSSQRWSAFMTIVLMICSLISVLTTLGIIVMLVYEAAGFFANEQIQLSRFFTDTKWSVGQTQGEIHYGILPLLSGTLRITAIAMLIALPLGVITAVFLSEFASPRVRSILKPALEVLAGVPTVVLGYFAMVFLTPYLLQPLGDFKTFNAASAGIAVGILCLPLVTSLAEDALRAVPRSLREGSLGLGATRFETTVKVVLPAAISGIVAAFLLALARAIGETMVVALAAGSTPTWTLDPRLQSQTMAGYIVNTFQSESVVPGSLSYYSIYSVAAVLFCLTFGITVLGQYVRRRFREEYN
ncbi:MAG: phosphate ABC transporter permease subunit PstC [Planctomycetota bacterium]|jgi:phosphate transport system permease protein|nr:phosphate ABC transporter permease subunit PstC [Blastopirellula sp.]